YFRFGAWIHGRWREKWWAPACARLSPALTPAGWTARSRAISLTAACSMRFLPELIPAARTGNSIPSLTPAPCSATKLTRAWAGVDEGIARGGTPGHRQGSVAGAMAVAGRDAPVPAVGQRAVGSPDGLADQADGARAGLGLLRTPRGAAWVHQENAHDAG